MNTDVYSSVTNKIVAMLEQGERPWVKPWNAEHAAGKITRPLRHNGLPYAGINVVMLWVEAVEMGYSAPLWITYKQAQELGGQVRRGEKGAMIVYANTLTRIEQDKTTGEDVEKSIPFMKGYTVFNAEQIDNLPAHYYAKAEAPKLTGAQRLDAAERFCRNTGVVVKHGGNRAFYAVATDQVQMPPFAFFKDVESYYATLLHECTHWTQHQTRLDRDFGRKKKGDNGYAMEELVAELGSAFLSADLGVAPTVREDHAAYIESWLTVLKTDKRAIFSAAAHAQRAAKFLHKLQPTAEVDPIAVFVPEPVAAIEVTRPAVIVPTPARPSTFKVRKETNTRQLQLEL